MLIAAQAVYGSSLENVDETVGTPKRLLLEG